MNVSTIFQVGDLDVDIARSAELARLYRQNLVDFTPWHLMTRDLALKRLQGLRQRYKRKYVPFARRQDNDDLACFDPAIPGQVIVIHDFASEGNEARHQFGSFWDWFRTVVEDMILFE